jgi:hypothetical protein
MWDMRLGESMTLSSFHQAKLRTAVRSVVDPSCVLPAKVHAGSLSSIADIFGSKALPEWPRKAMLFRRSAVVIPKDLRTRKPAA